MGHCRCYFFSESNTFVQRHGLLPLLLPLGPVSLSFLKSSHLPQNTPSISSLLPPLLLFAGDCGDYGVHEDVDGCILAGLSETSLGEGELNK